VFLTKPVQNNQALEGEVAVERPRMGMETLPIEELELGVRSFNCLRAAGVETLGDLTAYREEELAEIPNFGKKSFQEVLDALKERNLSLGD
jgi:DNA-directed RNA polymerase subunit alpha